LEINLKRIIPKEDLVEEEVEEKNIYNLIVHYICYMLNEDLEKYVNKWVLVDDQLIILQEKTKTMREWKKKLTDKILEMMEEKGLSNKILSISNGELSVQEKREYSSLSYSFIEDCLEEIISDKEKVADIIDYLRDNREIKTVKEIRRKNLLTTK